MNGPPAAWQKRAHDLAAWAMQWLVNRADAYGAYTPPHRRGQPGHDGKPVPKNYTSKRLLTLETLARHFRGYRPEHVIGLHSTSAENTARWGAFDIDRHGDGVDPAATLAAAQALYRESIRRGFRPLLTHSDGNGSYHLRLILRGPVPSRDLYHLLGQMVRATGFVVEHFPKQAQIKPGGFGNWLRLPGRHHTRDAWAEVMHNGRWLAGAEAVEALLTYTGDDPVLVPPAPAEKPRTPAGRTPFRGRAENGSAPLDRRIARYVACCPNLAEGQGRDSVAYNLAAFLVHDLKLSDDQALPWLAGWDRLNTPPKGDDRLRVIVGNARIYGQGGRHDD